MMVDRKAVGIGEYRSSREFLAYLARICVENKELFVVAGEKHQCCSGGEDLREMCVEHSERPRMRQPRCRRMRTASHFEAPGRCIP